MMSTYPASPKEMTGGMMYFPRMLDKIRLHARGELDRGLYHPNLGKTTAADGACTNFLRVGYAALRDRVLAGGSNREILEWCFEKGRRLNGATFWLGTALFPELGWRDFATPRLKQQKEKRKCGIADRTGYRNDP